MRNTTIKAVLRGTRPIMFDRYGGDNNTKLPVQEKAYTDESGRLGIPVLNIYSMLSAENTPSVAKRFHGKQARNMALGIQSFVDIQSNGPDPYFCILTDEQGNEYKSGDEKIIIMHHVARLAKGVPNPKERPVLPQGWSISIVINHQHNQFVSLPNLKNMFEQGGILGLGTFRPIFGRYIIETWDEI